MKQGLARYDFFAAQIAECEAAIHAQLDACLSPEGFGDGDMGEATDRRAKPEENLRRKLTCLMRVDLTAIPTMGIESALSIESKLGADLSAFPSVQHFCSWLGLPPGTRISGDKRLRPNGLAPVNRVGQALQRAAVNARRSQTCIGAKHRARLARLETPKAIKATAREMAELTYLMLTRGQPFVERGIQTAENERRKRKVLHLKRHARELGFNATEQSA